MKAYWFGAAMAALVLTGCGKGGDDSAAANNSAGPAAMIPAPNGGEWAEVVSKTPEGGFVMGNPDAPVKVIEYGSLTCPHCADFAVNGLPQLIDKYVKTGQVSFESRNYVRDPIDMTAALLARCGGAKPYFKLSDQLFARQEQWMTPFQSITDEQAKRLSAIPAEQQFGELAKVGGLIQFVKMRGIPETKANACLADKTALDELVSVRNAADSQYKVTGTPTFVLNGKVVENAASWGALEPAIRKAVG